MVSIQTQLNMLFSQQVQSDLDHRKHIQPYKCLITKVQKQTMNLRVVQSIV